MVPPGVHRGAVRPGHAWQTGVGAARVARRDGHVRAALARGERLLPSPIEAYHVVGVAVMMHDLDGGAAVPDFFMNRREETQRYLESRWRRRRVEKDMRHASSRRVDEVRRLAAVLLEQIAQESTVVTGSTCSGSASRRRSCGTASWPRDRHPHVELTPGGTCSRVHGGGISSTSAAPAVDAVSPPPPASSARSRPRPLGSGRVRALPGRSRRPCSSSTTPRTPTTDPGRGDRGVTGTVSTF
ncbi:hypothetical protein QJS66_17580 [Kocuria rhizophila]|nr:hypothetical protein QJS66_17580 [Kocuria rhizophila]